MAKYFTYFEFIRSATAEELEIDNEPKEEYIQDNILELMGVMDKIREEWTDYCEDNCLKDPQIIVNSGYRCEALNTAIKGAKNSAHKNGSTVDFEAKNGHNKALFGTVRRVLSKYDIAYDQLINEHNYSWIHLGLKNNNGQQRKQTFDLC